MHVKREWKTIIEQKDDVITNMLCMDELHCYRPQRNYGKVMFLHLSVILFTGGCVGRHSPQPETPWADTSPSGQTHPWTDTSPPLRSACLDTVNKRAVRILLEYFLVVALN